MVTGNSNANCRWCKVGMMLCALLFCVHSIQKVKVLRDFRRDVASRQAKRFYFALCALF
jgi:hypothetical protein